MAKSMTGYGRGEFRIGAEGFAMEVKSLNHRFIDIHSRVPERFSALETRIREEIKKRFSRGSFSVYISQTTIEAQPLKLNLAAARAYMDAAGELKKELGIKGEADLELFLKLKDIFTVEKKAPVVETDWEEAKKGLYAAFDELEAWRVREGVSLKSDLLERLSAIERLLSSIESRAPRVLEAYRNRLKDEIEKLVKEKVEESRILLEAAIFAERSDINEEIVRFRSHLKMFRGLLEGQEAVGKKLDFLCQETGREANTIGSKSSDIGITQTIIEIKGELEKIREQVQNVE